LQNPADTIFRLVIILFCRWIINLHNCDFVVMINLPGISCRGEDIDFIVGDISSRASEKKARQTRNNVSSAV